MTTMASQITCLTVVYSIVYLDADQRKHQSSASLAFVKGIHQGPVNSPHKGTVTRKNVSIWWRHYVYTYRGLQEGPVNLLHPSSLRFVLKENNKQLLTHDVPV